MDPLTIKNILDHKVHTLFIILRSFVVWCAMVLRHLVLLSPSGTGVIAGPELCSRVGGDHTTCCAAISRDQGAHARRLRGHVHADRFSGKGILVSSCIH